MDREALVFEVSEKSFNRSVILNSNKIPVLVEFMSIWSEPCVIMADLFSGLAKEFAERFIFAKIDIDEHPMLREKFKIKNVPTLLVFRNGRITRTDIDQLFETQSRNLLKEFGIYHSSDLMREEAREKHISGDTSAAILQLTDAIKQDPRNARIAMDMVQIFIDIGELDDARGLYSRFPEEDKSSEMGRALAGQLLFMELAKKTEGLEALRQRVDKDASDHSARFDLALCQVAQHKYREAMENLLTIQMVDPGFKDGAAQELIATLVNILSPTDPDLAQNYRRKLANILAE